MHWEGLEPIAPGELQPLRSDAFTNCATGPYIFSSVKLLVYKLLAKEWCHLVVKIPADKCPGDKIPVEEIPVVKIPFGDYGENSSVQISVYKIPPSKFWCIKFLWSKILSIEFL